MLTLTPNAVKKVKEYVAADTTLAGRPLRVYVEAGGCSGFQYGFAFDEKREGDSLLSLEGVDLVIDVQSAPYLKGSQVDYVEGATGAGFTVKNPNASGSCGCGHSFHV